MLNNLLRYIYFAKERTSMNIRHNNFRIITLFFSVLLCTPLYTQHDRVMLSFGNKAHSRDFTNNRSHHDFSHNNTYDNSHFDKGPSPRRHLSNYTAQDFQQYHAAYGYTENQILKPVLMAHKKNGTNTLNH